MSRTLTCEGCAHDNTPDKKIFMERCMSCKRAYKEDSEFFQKIFDDKYEIKETIECPVCNGTGMVASPLNGIGKITCTKCNGVKTIVKED